MPSSSARTWRTSSCPTASRSTSTPSCPTRATWPSARRASSTFVGTRKEQAWAVTDRDKDRVADEVKRFAPSLTVRHAERRLLLEGRLPVHRRAEPRADLPGGGVLLREPGRRGRRRRAGGRADPARGGIVQPHGARLRRRAGQQALHLARPALQRAARRRRRTSTASGASAASSAWTATARTARSTRAASATRSARISARHRRAVVHRQPGRRHGRRHPAGRVEPHHRPGPAFRLPLVRRRLDPHQRIQGLRAARRRRSAGRRIHRARGRSRHDVLHRQPVPGRIPGRHLLRPARLVEPHRAGRRARDVHAGQRRTARSASRRSSPKAGLPIPANISAGRSTWRSFPTARSSSPTTSPARSIASPTATDRRWDHEEPRTGRGFSAAEARRCADTRGVHDERASSLRSRS